MTSYRYQVNYSKRFTSGVLQGRLYHTYLRFASWRDADAFRQLVESGHVFQPCAGDGSYRCEDATISALEPTTKAVR